MNRVIRISQILVYYDLPELFLGKDSVGTNYVSMLIQENNDLKYLSTQISKNKASQFICGNIDLRSIYESPEINEFYILDCKEENIYTIEQQFLGPVREEWMPLPGFFLNNSFGDNNIIVQESIEKENAIVHLAISDEKDDFGIETDDLGDIVKLYSLLVENCFKKAVTQRKVPDTKSFIIEDNYKLRAFASSAASFNLHLFSESNKDLFGNTMIELGLEKIDEIFMPYEDEKDLINALRSIKGHGVSSFSKILKKVSSDNLKIKHKWFAPSRKHVNINVIDRDKAERVLNVITSTVELSEEIKEFTGHFVQVDLHRETWRLKVTDVGKEIFGTATSDQLAGITIDTLEYNLVCVEIIEEYRVSEKAKISYILRSMERID